MPPHTPAPHTTGLVARIAPSDQSAALAPTNRPLPTVSAATVTVVPLRPASDAGRTAHRPLPALRSPGSGTSIGLRVGAAAFLPRRIALDAGRTAHRPLPAPRSPGSGTSIGLRVGDTDIAATAFLPRRIALDAGRTAHRPLPVRRCCGSGACIGLRVGAAAIAALCPTNQPPADIAATFTVIPRRPAREGRRMMPTRSWGTAAKMPQPAALLPCLSLNIQSEAKLGAAHPSPPAAHRALTKPRPQGPALTSPAPATDRAP